MNFMKPIPFFYFKQVTLPGYVNVIIIINVLNYNHPKNSTGNHIFFKGMVI